MILMLREVHVFNRFLINVVEYSEQDTPKKNSMSIFN